MLYKEILPGKLVREGQEKEEDERILLGVISDTHVPTRAKAVPGEVFQIFEKARYIIHAGDIVDLSVIQELERIAPVVAVKGNMDLVAVRERYPYVDSIEVLGWRIGVVHDGIPALRKGKLKKLAKKNGFDVLVFGHSHRGVVKIEDGILFINPGSPTRPLLSKPSVGILEVTKKKIHAEIRVIGKE